MYKMYYETKIGYLTIVEKDNFIIEISFGKNEILEAYLLETSLIRKTIKEINEYLEGKRKNFDIPIKYNGTDFQNKVWASLLNIPYGKTCSYQDIAININNKKAVRAVGMANHNNPLVIIIPCHRVIGKNNKLVGYGGGLLVKDKLLNLEKEVIKKSS